MYNKTALNKIKKADLIALFLEQQAEKNQLVLDSEVTDETLKEENKKLKNDLRLCADGLIPDGMVGGIVECEREKRHKAEEENEKLKEENEKLKWDCEAGWNRVEHAHKMLKLKEENKEAEDNLDEEMLKNEKLEVEIKKLKSTIIVKKALINHWKNKYDEIKQA